ncbi:MAG: hypothetical protein A3C35_03400 [Omnitrophica bacterium RIFCSPHIGHO2_02_FULL_46_11]|nr:MAG: hypothetical protein A3A81_05050 [Omnitrophica bacterium RIFCSPLOWO2_01_FULL_45_10b]OGW85777.1 MAG: hypothetical protein A3C35_03400 [Omnitrophica bacterium RIFCSPHIGHO2_02_FULL_46_11]
MKRFPILIVLLAFLVTGCRENYLAEKAFYHANKTLKAINAASIEADPKKALEPAIPAFENVAEKYPTTQQGAESLFTISDLRIKQKDFDGARLALQKVIQNFTGNGEWAPEARFKIGRIYETDGLWQKAEEAYWETTEYHPLSAKGLYTPLYILLHYKQAKNVLKQNEAYERAVEHFEETLREVGPIEASASIRNSLAMVHLAQGNQNKARTEWNSLVEQFPKSPYAPLALLTIADISIKQQDFDQAFLDYENFFKRYAQHSVAGRTTIHIGLLHQARKEFKKSREWFEKAMTEYFQKEPSSTADLKLLIGKSYQDEGLWDEAEKMYREIESNYSDTAAALQVPLVRFLHYRKVGEVEMSKKVLDEAIARYKRIMKERPNSKMAAYAKKFMFSAYTQKKDWNQFMASVDQELQNETVEERKGRWLFLKALIAENRLRDRERAAAFYQDFLARYPSHPLSQIAKNHQDLLSKTQKV